MRLHFITGHPHAWYGQMINPEGFVTRDFPEAKTVEVQTVTLVDLLMGYCRVDLIDMDIQGTEFDVVLSSIDTTTKKAQHAFVATHSAEIRVEIGCALKVAGCISVARYGCTGTNEETPIGSIEFQDGVQYWHNFRIARSGKYEQVHRSLRSILDRRMSQLRPFSSP